MYLPVHIEKSDMQWVLSKTLFTFGQIQFPARTENKTYLNFKATPKLPHLFHCCLGHYDCKSCLLKQSVLELLKKSIGHSSFLHNDFKVEPSSTLKLRS